jgi:polyisoprenyl-teichoic acid--peptidoglycan teichoic acid transferase
MDGSEVQPNRRLDGPVKRPIEPAPAAASLPPAVPAVMPVEFTPQQSVEPVAPPPKFKQRQVGRASRRPWLRWTRRFALGLAVVLLVTGGVLGFKFVMAARHIITGSHGAGAPALKGITSASQLKGEGDGRINILILGVGGAGHDGPELSDTMMVASIDPKTKDVAMLSIPRDLYVKIPGHGQGKVNSANSAGGPQLAEQVVQTVLGVPIHYYIKVDFSGFKQAVDAVGGVDIYNKTSLYDPEYPCDYSQAKSCGFHLAAGQYHMNGTLALEYARCRKGTCGNDFGRASRQQDVLVALRQRALQLSTLTNPVKIAGLIDALGGHITTDLRLGDIEKLAGMLKDVDTSKINQKVLTTAPGGLLTESSGTAAGYIEYPAAGMFNYSDIQDLAHNLFIDHYITDENAKVQIENGSGISGLAGRAQTSLLAAHYTVLPAINASQYYAHTTLIDYTGGKKPYTVNYLEHRFGVTVKMQSPPPTATPTAGTTAAPVPDIVVILGADYHEPGTTITPTPSTNQ